MLRGDHGRVNCECFSGSHSSRDLAVSGAEPVFRVLVSATQVSVTGKNFRIKMGMGAKPLRDLVDLVGIEPTTSSMPWKRAPNCATGPLRKNLDPAQKSESDKSILAYRVRLVKRRSGNHRNLCSLCGPASFTKTTKMGMLWASDDLNETLLYVCSVVLGIPFSDSYRDGPSNIFHGCARGLDHTGSLRLSQRTESDAVTVGAGRTTNADRSG
jgi:hypothetical protein